MDEVESKFTQGVNVSVNDCLSVYVALQCLVELSRV